jgi:hypothetical protein
VRIRAMLVEHATSLYTVDRPLGLWIAEIGTRMTVIRLADGGLFLHSPVRLDTELRADLDALGPVRAIVAPSKAHHLFVGDYVAAYPEAVLFAAPGVGDKRRELVVGSVLGDDPPRAWTGEIEQHLVRGVPALNEVLFFHVPSRTLLVTDLVFNVPRSDVAGARMFYAMVGAADRFAPHRIVRLAFRDKTAARRSIDTVLDWDFDRVVVSHGRVLENGGREKFRAAFGWL